MKEKEKEGEKLIVTNRKAHFNYFLSDFQEAGIELVGSEIKSLRLGHCSIDESYVIFKGREAFILNMNIPTYQENGVFQPSPLRTRKLLLHKKEIIELIYKVDRQGYTVIPTRVYIKKGKAKVQIALGKGKKNYDKRETIKERENKINIQRKFKERY